MNKYRLGRIIIYRIDIKTEYLKNDIEDTEDIIFDTVSLSSSPNNEENKVTKRKIYCIENKVSIPR